MKRLKNIKRETNRGNKNRKYKKKILIVNTLNVLHLLVHIMMAIKYKLESFSLLFHNRQFLYHHHVHLFIYILNYREKVNSLILLINNNIYNYNN